MRYRRRRALAASSVTAGLRAGSGRSGSGGRRALRGGSCFWGLVVTLRFSAREATSLSGRPIGTDPPGAEPLVTVR